MKRAVLLSLGLACLAASLALGPAAAFQTDAKKPARIKNLDDLADKKITLELQESTLKDALERLFKKVPVNHVMMFDTSVDTKITMKMENVPFEGALTCILRSVKRLPLQYSTAGDVLLISPDTRHGEQVSSANLKVWMDVEDVDVRFALTSLLKAVRASYTCDSHVQARFSISLAAEPFQAALEKLCKNEKAPLSYTVEDGLFRITDAR
jgi:hypothetical protein